MKRNKGEILDILVGIILLIFVVLLLIGGASNSRDHNYYNGWMKVYGTNDVYSTLTFEEWKELKNRDQLPELPVYNNVP